MSAALIAMAAALLAAGWYAVRSSHRAARLWAAAALSVLAAANALQIAQAPGPWWPLHRMVSAGEGIAAVLWIAGLALVWRARQRNLQPGLAILACGVVVFAFGLGTAAIGKFALSGYAPERGIACPGKPLLLNGWTTTLRSVQPVLGPDYTGVQADVDIRFADDVTLNARPEWRDTIAGGQSTLQGAQTLSRWNGELLVRAIALPNSPDCTGLVLEWQPFGQWLRYGAWLGLVGAMALLANSLRDAWWRSGARERIAMRSGDLGRPRLPASAGSMGWRPLVMALACGVIAFGWQAAQREPLRRGQRAAVNGAALIAARQRLFGGPHLGNRWLVIADALARHGQFGDAAQILQGAVAKEPGNAEAWLALGDALYGHAGGSMVAAAQLAYTRAGRVAARGSGSSSLVASALAASGRKGAAADWVCRDSLRYRQCPD